MSRSKNWLKTVVSFLIVFCFYPLVKRSSSFILNADLTSSALCSVAVVAGALGIVFVILGAFSDSDTGRTLWGLVGALLFWTGLVEILMEYYCNRYGISRECAVFCSVGFCVAMGVLYYGTGNLRVNTSIRTFSAYVFYMWLFSILIGFVSDESIFGASHVAAYVFAGFCLLFSIFLFLGQLNCRGWDDNFREAILTTVSFWTALELAVDYDMMNFADLIRPLLQ